VSVLLSNPLIGFQIIMVLLLDPLAKSPFNNCVNEVTQLDGPVIVLLSDPLIGSQIFIVSSLDPVARSPFDNCANE
jgi:hypothetical protein